jgi:soluble lytic murein transglycosylase
MLKPSRLAVVSLGGLLSIGLIGGVPAPHDAAYAQPGAIAGTIAEWESLRRNASAPFESLARFLTTNRNWPGEADLRRRAERNIVLGATDPSQVMRYFAALPPLTAQGHAAHALALEAMGQRASAAEAARRAWRAGAMPEQFEQRLQAVFGAQLAATDHEARADALLAAGDTAGARRVLPLLGAERQAIVSARLSGSSGWQEAGSGFNLSAAAARDPGLLYDRARAASRSNPAAARQLLASRQRFDRPAANPEQLMELMISLARGAAEDGNSRQAYEIASKIDDIYPAGTDISTLSYGERDEYTNLAWLAGRSAFKAGRHVEAMGMFDRYARGAASLQVRAKGYYWAGRAAAAAGQAERASGFFEQAARNPEQFYGMLALERLGRIVPPPAAPAQVTAEERAAFARNPVVQAIGYLGSVGRRGDQTQFIRSFSSSLEDDRVRTLAADYGRSIGRLDMAVWAAREARGRGDDFYSRAAFPVVPIPPAYNHVWAQAHGIMRQESSFERTAQSPVGARGMMQLMPTTAAAEARRLGVPFSVNRLIDDADYNILIGSHHLAGLMERFDNNLVLVAVAYNAGAGRVPQWIARNGDFRTGAVDVVDWIEDIPFTETRGYVQRVIENTMAYDLMNPAGSRSGGRISYFLGRTVPR